MTTKNTKKYRIFKLENEMKLKLSEKISQFFPFKLYPFITIVYFKHVTI